mmetsp:Transcript_22732/g.33955  ORF Transcript_22732/g.33955 Transcript_22732/m.33955 type:complete len:182 (-) Transcript_22732:98-643(-)
MTTINMLQQTINLPYFIQRFGCINVMKQKHETNCPLLLSTLLLHTTTFFAHMKSNEPTFVILSFDISELYVVVSGAEKALLCCLDTDEAFSPNAIRAAKGRGDDYWFEQMGNLASRMEDYLLTLLLSLAKTVNGSKYKEMYRQALKMKQNADHNTANETMEETFEVHNLLIELKRMNSIDT